MTSPPPSAPRRVCGAGVSSLYFAPNGDVRACCVNREHVLGRAGEQRLMDVWHGAPMAELRDALDRGDWSLGCESCAHFVDAGDRGWSTAVQFDRYLGDDVGAYPRRLELTLSNTCNLMCRMCSGELSSAIRSRREHLPPLPSAYGDAFFDDLRELLPHAERVVLLGGEPFLARESQRALDLMVELGVTAQVDVVTNGTHWNARVERWLRELDINLAVSVDGATAETFESIRVGARFADVMANVARYTGILRPKGGNVSFNHCLMVGNWHELGAFLATADAGGHDVEVTTVTGPDYMSLFHLPVPRLREVVDALGAQDAWAQATLGRNLPVWDGELDRLRRHLASLDGAPVEVARAPAAPAAPPPPLGAIRAELLTATGLDPLELVIRDGFVESLHAPPWAVERLGADAWTGEAMVALRNLIARRIGPQQVETATPRDDGVVEALAVFANDTRDVPIRILVAEDRRPEAFGTVHMMLAVLDGA